MTHSKPLSAATLGGITVHRQGHSCRAKVRTGCARLTFPWVNLSVAGYSAHLSGPRAEGMEAAGPISRQEGETGL